MNYTQAKECLKNTDKDTLRELLNQYEEDIIYKYLEEGYSLDDMQEAYQGQYSSDEDFVQQLLEDIGSVPSDLPHYVYIDWTRTACDVMIDYFEIDGHYFRQL